MKKHTTRKCGRAARAVTLARKARRAVKYAPAPALTERVRA